MFHLLLLALSVVTIQAQRPVPAKRIDFTGATPKMNCRQDDLLHGPADGFGQPGKFAASGGGHAYPHKIWMDMGPDNTKWISNPAAIIFSPRQDTLYDDRGWAGATAYSMIGSKSTTACEDSSVWDTLCRVDNGTWFRGPSDTRWCSTNDAVGKYRCVGLKVWQSSVYDEATVGFSSITMYELGV